MPIKYIKIIKIKIFNNIINLDILLIKIKFNKLIKYNNLIYKYGNMWRK